MTDPPPAFNLGALSAKLREDDEQFRRTFALGQLAALDQVAVEDGAGLAAFEPEVRSPPISGLGAGFLDLRARLQALVEARIGVDGVTGAERADRLLATMPPVVMPVWLSALEAEPIDGPDWTAVIEALTVSETYFCRDSDQLAFIRREVLAPLIAARKHEARARLLCWCAGCASGEEVYSLAMLIVEVLREAGEAELRGDGRLLIHPRWRIQVLGTDLDRAALRYAQAGRYADFPMGPFRSLPGALAGYFEMVPPERAMAVAARVVRPEIRALTAFQPFNLVEATPPVLGADLVLCRNVLIYLSDRTRSHAQGVFHHALDREGVLALGPTDVLRRPELFHPLWGPGTVLYRKR